MTTLPTPPSSAPGGAMLDEHALLAATFAPLGRRELVPGIMLVSSLALDRGSVRIAIEIHGLSLWSTTLDGGKLTERWSANQGIAKEDLEFTIDLERGDLAVSGEVALWSPTGWKSTSFDDVLVGWSPALGLVGADTLAHGPVVDDAAFGTTRSIVPTITRILVDATPRDGTNVGSLVKSTYFPHTPGFVFNVCFSVGAFPIGGPGPYTDPTSPWFNVFLGYYQIDCPKPDWTRPFGYDLGPNGRTVRFDDVLRVGKADWNFFSNWMYGVPLDAIAPFIPLDPGVVCQSLGERTVARSRWDLIDTDGFSAVTAYTSSAPGAKTLEENTSLTRLWRVTYGEPAHVAAGNASFPGASMHARFYMAFREDADAFHTVLFGGTVNKTFDGPSNDALLAAQMSAAEKVITDHYPALGFALP